MTPLKSYDRPSSMEIILSTLNATYSQTSLGLRYLFSNMGSLEKRTKLIEFTISQQVHEIAEKILKEGPKIVGLSLYIWNFSLSLQLIKLLKRIDSNLIIVVGGPEVSFEYDNAEGVADYIICGEGEEVFPRLCLSILSDQRPLESIIKSELIDLSKINYPYDSYNDHDIQNRRIMVESSRGCPFECQFCLSSLDQKVRHFELESFLLEMKKLWDRGARDYKFIDRTFNLDNEAGVTILNFFEQYKEMGLSLHFEIVPDHLHEKILNAVAQFPPGIIQFEIGVQSFNQEVSDRIGRRQNYRKVEENIKRVVDMGNVHIHADLIVGLPGENLDSFGNGFDRLRKLAPHEIQVGILKKLKGAPISIHQEKYKLIFDSLEPYSILQTGHMDYGTIRRMTRFARFWDIFGNSGNFKRSIRRFGSFDSFMKFSDWLYERSGQTHAISLERQVRLLLEYNFSLKDEITADYMSIKGRTLPPFLREKRQKSAAGQKRQQKHRS